MKCSEYEIKVVIGASYGDEGKGLMTDYFCRNALEKGRKCITVLHNGGAQRGHTVSVKNGIRHVFHHLSSGTFSFSDTYFSDTFIINPMVFAGEYSGLLPDTRIYCSSECRWSTPFDMIINQIAEDNRGGNRHGSCGFGIWETIVRYNSGTAVSFPEFMSMDIHEKKAYLKNIRDSYLPERLEKLQVRQISHEWQEIIKNDGLIENFIDDCEYFAANTVMTDSRILEKYSFIVFEGAQGLLLSQDSGENEKYTTPSFTGAENPVKMICELSGKINTEVCYVTRSYLTRHGAGFLENECPKSEINPDMVDLTNVPNDYQGALRYGKLDLKNLQKRITDDFAKFSVDADAKMSVSVTHLNETKGMIAVSDGYISVQDMGFDKIYCSYNESEVNNL